MKQYCDGGEAILEAFRNCGTDYLISSPGSEWSPVWEALARQKVNQKPGPTYLECWHETLAVDIALGYTQITGRPQGVLLHAGAGLLQGAAGMHSALLAEVPMVLLSGESLTFGEDPTLAIEPQWYRNLSIVGGPHRLVEPVTKWASQATSAQTIYESVTRAVEFSQRTPAGPVYLDVPLESMLHEWTPPEHARKVPAPVAPQAPAAEVERIAQLIVKAKNPIIITESAGRDARGFAALVEFAELVGAPVGGGRATDYGNFPKNNPLWLGYAIDRHVKDSDLVLLVASRAPWYPPSRRPTTGTIVAIDANPLKGTMVYQSLQADHYLEGEVAGALRQLTAALRAGGLGANTHADRRARWRREHETMLAEQRAALAKLGDASGIEPLVLCEALSQALPRDTVFVDETITHAPLVQQNVAWIEPQSYFRVHGGLGQGLGVALGVKLAMPKRPVALVIGDGSFLYNPVIQGLGATRNIGLPILIVVVNNRRYEAMRKGHVHHYPDGVAQATEIFHGVHIDGPDYDELAKPFGLHGEKVEKPAQLKPALENAMRAVRDGKSAIVNVMVAR